MLVGWPAAGRPALAADEPVAAGAVAVEPSAADAAAIRAAAGAYRDALAKGDAEALRRAWADGGDVVDAWGNVFPAADVAAVDGGSPGRVQPEIRVKESRLRLITPDVVLEDGAVDVVIPGTNTPLEGWFSAIWHRQGAQWKLASIREVERPTTLQADVLDDLDWMVGDWTVVPEEGQAASGAPAMTMTVRWDAGRMFLVRDVKLSSRDPAAEPVTVDVQQRIGWDPLVGRIRSWSFATDGTRGEATWFRDGNSWIAKGTTIQADGTQETTVHIYTYDGKDRYVWRTMREPLAGEDGVPARVTWVRKPKGAGP